MNLRFLLVFNFFPKKDNTYLTSYFKKAQFDFLTEPPPQNKLDISNFDVGAMFLTILIFPLPRNGF